MKKFYLLWCESKIFQTLSEKSEIRSGEMDLKSLALRFPLPWSAIDKLKLLTYLRLSQKHLG